MPITKLTTLKEFTTALKKSGDKLMVIDFYATWCGPCKYLAPKLEDLSNEYTDVKFYKVDIGESKELTKKYNIQSMPTIIYFKKGVIIQTIIGADYEKILNTIKENV